MKVIGYAEGAEFKRGLVYELCADGTLQDALQDSVCCRRSAGWRTCTGWTTRVRRAEVLDRDVKRSNVGLCGGRAKLMNCGSTALAGGSMGTVGYIAPEVLEGCPYTARSEVFSFGTLLLVMLTGLHAFARPPEQPRAAVHTLRRLLTNERGKLKPDFAALLLQCITEWSGGGRGRAGTPPPPGAAMCAERAGGQARQHGGGAARAV